MQESWEFHFPSKIGRWQEEDFKSSTIQVLERNKIDLGILLSYYYKNAGGLVEGVKLENEITMSSPTSGFFKVRFDVVHFNACLDIHQVNQDSMTLQMNLNTETDKLKITGPLWPEREPDEI